MIVPGLELLMPVDNHCNYVYCILSASSVPSLQSSCSDCDNGKQPPPIHAVLGHPPPKNTT